MIWPIESRGLSDANGSWKTICISRRNGRIALKLSPWMSRLANVIDPALRSRRSSAKPSVVLPEPDSPTTPTVWPSRTSIVTPSTART